MSMNATIEKFGYPASLIADYDHWVLLVRPVQVTAGSLVLAAKSDANAFGSLPSDAHAELANVTRELEALLRRAVDFEKINYLMLMMIDPHVHFHIFPRYEGHRTLVDERYEDAGWPGQPALSSGIAIASENLSAIRDRLRSTLEDTRRSHLSS